jgi:hypothetical protein
MTAKTKASKMKRTTFFPVGLVLLLFLASLGYAAVAENEASLDQNGIRIDSASGITSENILSSLEEGGLVSPQNLDEIKQTEDNQPPQSVPASDQEPVEPEKIQSDINTNFLKELESQGGLSSKPQNDSKEDTLFKSVTKFLDRVVFRGNVEFTKTPEFDEGMNISGTPTFDKDTAGYALIKKGNQSVDIEFEQEYDFPPVVTATLSLQQYNDPEVTAAAEDLLLVSDVKFIVTKTSQKGFEIMMDHIADSDIPFSWHALAVKDPETFKKKGAILKNATLPFRFNYADPSNSD